jgi:hypothetical protein
MDVVHRSKINNNARESYRLNLSWLLLSQRFFVMLLLLLLLLLALLVIHKKRIKSIIVILFFLLLFVALRLLFGLALPRLPHLIKI